MQPSHMTTSHGRHMRSCRAQWRLDPSLIRWRSNRQVSRDVDSQAQARTEKGFNNQSSTASAESGITPLLSAGRVGAASDRAIMWELARYDGPHQAVQHPATASPMLDVAVIV